MSQYLFIFLARQISLSRSQPDKPDSRVDADVSVLDDVINSTRNWFAANRAYFLAYAVWVISGAFITLPLLYGPPAVSGILQVLDATRWAISAVQRFGFVGVGLLWLVAVLLSEHYLRTSVGQGELGKAIRKVATSTGIVVVVTGVVYFLPALLSRVV